MADRYITDREFPDKAIDIMDEVGARSQISVKLPEEIEKLKEKANQIKQEKINVVKAQDYEKAAHLTRQEKKILKELDKVKADFEKRQDEDRQEITEDMVYDVVSNMTKIPVSKLNQNEMEGLVGIGRTS